MIKLNGKNLCEHCFSEIEDSSGACSQCTCRKNNEKYLTALPEGTILAGRYIVGRVLGKGGFGITYLCYDTKDEKRVAVKEYLPDSLSHRNTGETIVSTFDGESEEYFKKGAQNFFEEAKLVSRFNGNPNIISVYEFFYENNTTYFVMEFLEGVDLKTYIKNVNRNLTEEEALFVATNICDALTIVHSLNVLHRDISPDNIFICNDSTVKLIDFGAARQILGEASKSLSVILKEGFAPLEQYQTRGKQGPWTDIYALGATLYYGLTGVRPDNVMTRITDDTALDFSKLPQGLAKVISKMIALKIEDRYQNTFELKKDITALTEVAPPPPPPVPAHPWHTKIKEFFASVNKKKLAAVAGSVAVVVAAVIIAVAVIPDKENVTGTGNVQQGTEGNGWGQVSGFENLTDAEETSAKKEEKTTKKKAEKTTKKVSSTKKPSTTKRKPSTTKKTTQKLSFKNRNTTLSAGFNYTVAIKQNGSVIATGLDYVGQCDVSDWKNIISVSAGNGFTLGLKSDGTVVATGLSIWGECDVSDWKNIVAVSAGNAHTAGLRSDGTVVARGKNKDNRCNVSDWKNIVSVVAGYTQTVGAKSNGTAVAVGNNDYGQCNVSGWKNIVAVSAGCYHTVGLKSDGTVVATGDNTYGQCDVSKWKNIVAIAAGENHTVGLKSDGTVVAVGDNGWGQCNVNKWKNIVAIDSLQYHTVGLKSDGTVVATGSNSNGESNVSGWKNIKIPK